MKTMVSNEGTIITLRKLVGEVVEEANKRGINLNGLYPYPESMLDKYGVVVTTVRGKERN